MVFLVCFWLGQIVGGSPKLVFCVIPVFVVAFYAGVRVCCMPHMPLWYSVVSGAAWAMLLWAQTQEFLAGASKTEQLAAKLAARLTAPGLPLPSHARRRGPRVAPPGLGFCCAASHSHMTLYNGW